MYYRFRITLFLAKLLRIIVQSCIDSPTSTEYDIPTAFRIVALHHFKLLRTSTVFQDMELRQSLLDTIRLFAMSTVRIVQACSMYDDTRYAAILQLEIFRELECHPFYDVGFQRWSQFLGDVPHHYRAMEMLNGRSIINQAGTKAKNSIGFQLLPPAATELMAVLRWQMMAVQEEVFKVGVGKHELTPLANSFLV